MTIEVSNLTKSYGTQNAVNNISFSVAKGEIVGFLGPNGAGKSTTMKIITTYILPTSGSVKVCGFDIYDNPLSIRRKTGYLPENNPLYNEMYVREYLGFIARMHGITKNKKHKVEEMIEITGLGIEAHKKLDMLSKGYKQRVGIAQALLHDPEVLILDEPTSGLDPNQIVEIRELIREIGKEKTVMLSTHIMQEVQAMCNRVMIINKGNIVADDDPSELLKKFAGKTVIKVQFKNEVDKNELMKIPGIEKVEYKNNFWHLQTSSEADIREHLFNFAVQNQNSVLEMSREGGNLENIFRQLTTSQI